MKFLSLLSCALLGVASWSCAGIAPVNAEDGPIAIVIHGGAGALKPGRYTPEEEEAFRAKLSEALNAGYAILEEGGSSLDAIEAAIVILEDAPMFNAGKGAVFTNDGKNELDASIMDGATLNAGAVAGVTSVKNPIRLARAVMEDSPHVMFAREGAEVFAQEQGLEIVSPDYFHTEHRRKQLDAALEREAKKNKRKKQKRQSALHHDFKFGTVGAVALDAAGDLAAGTSTGGMTAKKWGRVGDSPIIGAGTYADNNSCAVSSTGWGEYFIRLTLARDICAQIEYGGKSVEEATRHMIHGKLTEMEAQGGVIVLSADGAFAMAFNSDGMFRGVKTSAEERVSIYRDEE